jgi:hypothetical protein
MERVATWLSWPLWLLLALALLAGCEKKKTPAQQVGDAFVEHYLRADQQGALEFAALGAAAQLKKEIEDTKEARKEAPPDIHVDFKRIGEESRDKRIVLQYQVTIEKQPPRSLRIEVTDLGAGPKVVLYEVK